MDRESKLPGRYRHSHIEKCHLIKAVISLRQIFIIANHYFAKGTYGNIFLGEGTGRQWGKRKKFLKLLPSHPKIAAQCESQIFHFSWKILRKSSNGIL